MYVLNKLGRVNDILQEIEAPVQNQKDRLSESLTGTVAKVTQDCARVFSHLNKLIDRLGRPGSQRQRVLFVFYADNTNAARSSLQA